MTDTDTTTTKTVDVKWHKEAGIQPPWTHIASLYCMPDVKHPDHFILTMDGPNGGEYGRIKVSRQQLLEMIVAADKERERCKTALAQQ